jgi:hypothetical protein
VLETFGALVGAGLSLDRGAIAAAANRPDALRAALLIALLGGISLTFGQSVILFANRVTPKRFVLLLFYGGLVYVVSLIVWGATIWLIATFGFRRSPSLEELVITLCVGQAPMLFGLLILLPYLGTGIQRVLEAYTLMVVVVAVSGIFGVRVWQALLLAGAGWVLRALISTLLTRPLGGVQLWLWRAASGQPTRLRPAEALPLLAERVAPEVKSGE